MSGQDDVFLTCPFWIDTDGYSSRDRDMFVSGFEYGLIYCNLVTGKPCSLVFGTENFDRVRMLLNVHQRKYQIVTLNEEYSRFDVEAA